MIKRFSKKLIVICILVMTFIATTICGISFAWLHIGSNEVSLRVDSGSFILQYFHTGAGTKDDPFVITRPIHYYHMVELYQRKPSFALGNLEDEIGEPYYFQIGYELDGNSSNGLEVYNYDDTGSVVDDDKYSKTLNMSYYSGTLALLPMGTSYVPFIGALDGKGLTVSNLHIRAVETIGVGDDAIVYKTSDVGIFGYIGGEYVDGSYDGGYVHDIYYENVTIDISGLEQGIDEIRDESGNLINPAISHSDHSNGEVYVGYLVGHLPVIRLDENGFDAESIFNNVYVNNCNVIGGDVSGSSKVQYGYIGHLDLLQYPDIQPATIKQIIEYMQGSSGTGSGSGSGGEGQGGEGSGEAGTNPGWGGSLNMKEFYSKMLTRKEEASDTSGYSLIERIRGDHFAHYITNETVYVTNGKVTSRVTNDSEFEGGSYANALPYRVYNAGVDNFEGSYYFYNSLLDNWVCFSSSSESHQKTVTYFITSDDAKDALIFYHTVGETKYYLGYDSSFNLTDVSSLDNAGFFAWAEAQDDGITRITEHNLYIVDSSSNSRYYLCTDGVNVYLTLSTSANSYTPWYVELDASNKRNDHMLYTLINEKKYYLVNGSDIFGSGASWMVLCEDGLIDISSNSQYMSISSGNLSTTNSTSNDAKWIYANNKLCTYSGSSRVYLTIDSSGFAGLTTAESSASTFNFSNNKLTTTFDGKTCVLVYGSGLFGINKWMAIPDNSIYKITDNGNNLYYSSNTISANTSSFTNWVYADNKIYTYTSSGRVYMTVDGNGFISTTTTQSSASSFTLGSSKVTTSFENAVCDLVYDTYFGTNKWMVVAQSLTLATIGDGTRYLNFNNGSVATSTTSATSWLYSNDGKVYTYSGTSKYYLNLDSNGFVTIGNSSNTAFTFSNNKITVTFDSTTCLLIYDSTMFKTNKWMVVPENNIFKISNGTNYLNNSSGSISTSTTGSTIWLRNSAGALYTYSGTTRYYLNIDSNALAYISTSAVSSFTVGTSQITVSVNGKTYYLTYDKDLDVNKWMAEPSTIVSINDSGNTLGYYRNLWLYDGEKVYTYDNNLARAFLYVTGIAVGITSDYNTATTFSHDGSKFYTSNGNLCYGKAIFPSGGYDWMILPTGSKITIQSGSVYLTTNGSTLSAGSSSIGWYLENGRIYTFISGTQYFLCCPIDTLSVSTSSSANWSVSSNTLKYSGTTINYYSQVGKWSKTKLYVIKAGKYYMTKGLGISESITDSQLIRVNSTRMYRIDYQDSKRLIKPGGYDAEFSDNDNYSSGKIQSDNSIICKPTLTYYLGVYKNNNSWDWRTNKNNLVDSAIAYIVALTETSTTASTTSLTLNHPTTKSVSQSTKTTVSASVLATYSTSTGSASSSKATYYSQVVSVVDTRNPFSTYSYTTKKQYVQKLDSSGNPMYDGSGNPIYEEQDVIDTETIYLTILDGKIANDVSVKIEDSTNYTYIPIMTKTESAVDTELTSDYAASFNNTGYIVSGVHEEGLDISNSDVRVRSYSMTNISNSLSDASTRDFSSTPFNSTDDAKLEILTRDPITGEFVRIKDETITDTDGTIVSSHNSTNSSPSTTVSSLSVKTVTELGLLGYQDLQGYYDTTLSRIRFRKFARDNLYNMMEGDSNVYGLRFMTETISAENTIMAKNVRLVGVDYEYYELPISCVDFKVQRDGRISFFAGNWTTTETSNAFFSLHKVFRDDNNRITQIKEIRLIYKGNRGYLYKFSDGTFYDGRNFYSSGATLIAYYPNLVFDMEWIAPSTGNLSLTSNAIYYFEIPVGAGEYALGSVVDHNGAYLLYLDVGANASAPIVPEESGDPEEVEVQVPQAIVSSDAVFTNLDYRVTGQVNDIDAQGRHRSIMTFSYSLPSDATEENFDIEVVYQGEFISGSEPAQDSEYAKYNIKYRDDYADDGDTKGIGSWCKGVYQIYIKYTGSSPTTTSFNLSVLLTDNDSDINNEFPYAYEILVYNAELGRYVATDNYEVNGGVEVYSGTLRRWSRSYVIYSTGAVVGE